MPTKISLRSVTPGWPDFRYLKHMKKSLKKAFRKHPAIDETTTLDSTSSSHPQISSAVDASKFVPPSESTFGTMGTASSHPTTPPSGQILLPAESTPMSPGIPPRSITPPSPHIPSLPPPGPTPAVIEVLSPPTSPPSPHIPLLPLPTVDDVPSRPLVDSPGNTPVLPHAASSGDENFENSSWAVPPGLAPRHESDSTSEESSTPSTFSERLRVYEAGLTPSMRQVLDTVPIVPIVPVWFVPGEPTRGPSNSYHDPMAGSSPWTSDSDLSRISAPRDLQPVPYLHGSTAASPPSSPQSERLDRAPILLHVKRLTPGQRTCLWQYLGFLGEGTFGKVCLASNIRQGGLYAVKMTDMRHASPPNLAVDDPNREANELFVNQSDARNFAAEVRTLLWTRQLGHPFVLGLAKTVDSPCWRSSQGFLHVVTDYCPGGSLVDHIGGSLDSYQLPLVMAEVLLGLMHLHSIGFIHMDLKPANILIDAHGHCRISDFGATKHTETPHLISEISTTTCTWAYASPEVLIDSRYSQASDYWSFGAIIFDLTVAYRPGDEALNERYGSYRNSLDHVKPRMEERGNPSVLIDFVQKLCTADWRQRMTGNDAKAAEYFKFATRICENFWHKVEGGQFPPFTNVTCPNVVNLAFPSRPVGTPGRASWRRQAVFQQELGSAGLTHIPEDDSFQPLSAISP